MKAGRVTSHAIVQQYLTRIALYEDKLNAAITVNPRALAEADERDRERAQGRVRGPLHGIPIALKDNVHTTNMHGLLFGIAPLDIVSFAVSPVVLVLAALIACLVAALRSAATDPAMLWRSHS